MPFTEDFSVFTNLQDFGEVGLWTPAGAAAKSVNGIFDRESQNELGMEGSGPTFGCAHADVPGIKHNDALVIAGVDYVVKGVTPDGSGWVVLVLELAP